MGRNDDDLALARACVASEPGAWQRFVDRFLPPVKAIARRYMRFYERFPDESELEDVVQEVFVALTRRDYHVLKNYDPTYTMTTYLGQITRTQVHRILRKRRPLLSDVDELERASAPVAPASDDVEAAEEQDVLTRALDELPERDAEILRLRFLREMDYRAIAETMRMPEASVGQTLYRAKQRLYEKLKRVFEPDPVD